MKRKMALSSGLALLVSACGGSSGGVGSTPTPTPTPTPPPTNVTMGDLRQSQSFTNDATGTSMRIDGPTHTGISGSSRQETLTIAYDAQTKSYSLSVAGMSQTFSPTTITQDTIDQSVYQPTSGDSLEKFTFFRKPYENKQETRQYVVMGYWQRNRTDATGQDLVFETFTYGLPTVAAAVPRTGTAAFRLDTFGAASAPGREPITFRGDGTFSVDFAAGIFSAQSPVLETSLYSGQGIVGGDLELYASGKLSSGDGTFSGKALYEGMLGSAAGTLSGRFYGPDGQELGASFSASNPSGMIVSGSFTGLRDNTLQPDNLTLTNLIKPQLFYTRFGYNLTGQLTWQNAETFTFGTPTSDLNGGQFTINDKVASSDPNFTTYRKTFTATLDTQDVTLQLFKPGPANTQLALTYASFGQWSTTTHSGVNSYPVDLFFFYGLETQSRLLSGRSGTGHYQGIAFGMASNVNNGQRDPLSGTSQFDVDFATQRLSGSLALVAKPESQAPTIDYGRFDFSGQISAYDGNTTVSIIRDGQTLGQMDTRFFGPDGEEIAGKFGINVPAGSYGNASSLSGVAAAKRQ